MYVCALRNISAYKFVEFFVRIVACIIETRFELKIADSLLSWRAG